MSIFNSYIDLVDRALSNLLTRIPWLKIRPRVRLGPLEFEFKTKTHKEYEQIFKQIETAQEHFEDALDAVDRLRAQFSGEKKKLEDLLDQVNAKRAEYDDAVEKHNEAAEKLATTRELLSKDQRLLRGALGFENRRDRLSGFVGGVIASLLATALWTSWPKIWTLLRPIVDNLGQGSP